MAHFFRFSAQKTKMMIFISEYRLTLLAYKYHFPHHKGTKKNRNHQTNQQLFSIRFQKSSMLTLLGKHQTFQSVVRHPNMWGANGSMYINLMG